MDPALNNSALRHFSKWVCASTLFLIFAGGMVTSTGSGLAVPDWPLSYGMVFPPMVGGVFYEHGHRMVASTVGFMVLCLAIWLHIKEKRTWIKKLGWAALILVICQGILGGITVKFFLPPPVSIAHGVIAQTFFILTIVLAYSLSLERKIREDAREECPAGLSRAFLFLGILIYGQLLLGALMRHTGSGLAIYDFPTTAGYWLPPFNETMLSKINAWRFDHDLPAVMMGQVVIHFIHRATALTILIFLCFCNVLVMRTGGLDERARQALYILNTFLLFQIALGILTVLTGKAPIITSLHVVTGAATLGVCVLLVLRSAPLSFKKLTNIISTANA